MYACATNEFERSTITDLLFGSVTDVLDRYLPDKEKHGALRGMLSLPGRATPPTADPRRPAPPRRWRTGSPCPTRTRCWSRSCGAASARSPRTCADVFTSNGGELRLRSKVDEILVADGRVTGVRLEDGSTLTAPVVVSGVAPDLTVNGLVDAAAVPADIRERFSRVDHRGSYLQMHFALDGIPEFAAPYELLNDPDDAVEHRHLQHARGAAAAVGGLQARHRARRSRRSRCRSRRCNDPGLAPPGKHAASAFSLWFPIEEGRRRATAR